MSTEHQPLVSVCISAYNVERVLAEALGSVLHQTYRNLEVIVLDNGSTDGTRAVLESFVDERMRAIGVIPNVGGYQGMNRAMGLARGDLIAVYHADDVYEPEIVEREVAHLQAHPRVGAVFAMDHYIDEDGRVFGGTSLPTAFRARESLDYADLLPFLLRRKNVLFRCPTFMTRRAVLDTVGYFDPETFEIGSDLEMWLRIARRFPVAILPDRLVRYRVGRRQWSSRYNRLRTEEERFFFVMDRYLELDGWPDAVSRRDLEEYAFHRCDDETFRAANWIIKGNPVEAWRLLRTSYPLRTFTARTRRRKFRVLALRTLMRAGLRLGAPRALAGALVWTEYGGRV